MQRKMITSNGVGKRLDARSSITTTPAAFPRIFLAVSYKINKKTVVNA